jgi:hypothetical protein
VVELAPSPWARTPLNGPYGNPVLFSKKNSHLSGFPFPEKQHKSPVIGKKNGKFNKKPRNEQHGDERLEGEKQLSRPQDSWGSARARRRPTSYQDLEKQKSEHGSEE